MSKTMSDLPKQLRIKAGMISLGERIAWGSDSALMGQAADLIEQQQARIDEMEQHITELEAQWVSVDERLPELGQDVLVFPIKMHLDSEPVYNAHLSKSGAWNYIWAGSIYSTLRVTHWMPLPQPPEEQGDE